MAVKRKKTKVVRRKKKSRKLKKRRIKGDKKNKALEYSSPVLNLSLEKLFISIQSWIPKTFQIIQCSRILRHNVYYKVSQVQ